jgi:hypothetical protein
MQGILDTTLNDKVTCGKSVVCHQNGEPPSFSRVGILVVPIFIYLFIYLFFVCPLTLIDILHRGRRGRDRMVVGFTTTYAISAYHH